MTTIDPVARFSHLHHGGDRLRGVVRLVDRDTRNAIDLSGFAPNVVTRLQPDDLELDVIELTTTLPNGGTDGIIEFDSLTPVSVAGAIDIRHATQTLIVGRINLERDTANG